METMNAEMDGFLNSAESKEYFELIRFASVSAEKTHLRDSVACATWLKKWLAGIGAEAELVLPPTDGASLPVPVVVGERPGAVGGATVLFYAHYDVQPAAAADGWSSPPFEPTVREGRVYARGAQDDKGQAFAFLCGLRDLVNDPAAAARLPTVRFVFDGEEESGSLGLLRLLERREFRSRLAADTLLVCDTSAAADLRPAVVAGMRGVASATVTLTAANRELHSGEYGGVAPNAAQGMAALVASLHHPDGSIAVAGFRDGIEPPSHEELELAEAGMTTKDAVGRPVAIEQALAADIGCEPAGGQVGKTVVQRLSFEPTIEVNGIHSGYGGEGGKTVIPDRALAKLSLRLVPGQSPRGAMAALVAHLKANCPRGMKVEVSEANCHAGGFRLPLTTPIFRLAEAILGEMDARGAVFQWDGASLPVVAALQAASGAAPLIVGWGQPEDRIHSPDESYSPRQFAKAREWARRILSAL